MKCLKENNRKKNFFTVSTILLFTLLIVIITIQSYFKETFIATIMALIVGTYLFFHQLTGWILQKMRCN
ncbi:hypothetical protein [Salipaludibacillus neizhouensis]|uniref:hypothetical protein n=1 Tax=Salipaludibacillus neizhouensis TaxID=885475 RepID=UPI0011C3F41A|nr:hypothetical protein [Salipaludibacillus neizhouensis]